MLRVLLVFKRADSIGLQLCTSDNSDWLKHISNHWTHLRLRYRLSILKRLIWTKNTTSLLVGKYRC